MAESRDTFLTDIDHSFRFEYDCDLAVADNERAIHNNLQAIAFQTMKGFFLNKNIGSRITMGVFEPNDIVTEELITSSVVDAIIEQEPRVIVNEKILYTTDTSGYVISARLYYKYKSINTEWETIELDLT